MVGLTTPRPARNLLPACDLASRFFSKKVLTARGPSKTLPAHTETTTDNNMRTKTLVLTAALGAVGVATAMAQVYSVNAVGYVNLSAKAGFNLWTNPLDAGADNTVAKLLAGVPDGSAVYTYAPGTGYSVNTLDLGEWANPNATLVPGQGFFLRVGGATTVTFVGEVKQGNLSTPLAAGFNLVGSQVPQAGRIQADLGLVPAEGDQVYKFSADTQGYSVSTFEFGAWDPAEPQLAVGEGVWVRKGAAGSWNRTFSVNP